MPQTTTPQTPLTAVADVVLGGPVLAEAMAEAGQVRALDLTGPAAVRPLVVKGLADAGRTGAGRDGHRS